MPMEYALSGMPNHIMMTRALNVYRSEMRRFIVKELSRNLGGGQTLDSLIRDALPDDLKTLFESLYEKNGGNASAAIDIAAYPHIVKKYWSGVFAQRLQYDRSFIDALFRIRNTRNEWAHPDEDDLDAESAIDNMKEIERVLKAIGSPDALAEVRDLRNELEAAPLLASEEWELAAAWDAHHSGAEDGSDERILFDGLSRYRKEMRAFIRRRATIKALDGGGSFESLLRDSLPSTIQSSLDEFLNENCGRSNVGIDIWYFPEMIDRYWQRSFANRFDGDQEFLHLAYWIRSALKRLSLLLDAEFVRGHLTLAARALELIGANARETRAEIQEMRDTAYPLQDAAASDAPDSLAQYLWRNVAEDWIPDDPNGRVFWEALGVYRQEINDFISNALADEGEFEELIQRILPNGVLFPSNHLAAEIWAFPRIVEYYWAQGFQQYFQNNREFENLLDQIRWAFNNCVSQNGSMEAENARDKLDLIARALEMMGASDAQAGVVALRDENYPPHVEEVSPFIEQVSPFSGMELPALADEASDCEECDLHNGRRRYRTKVVFGAGNENADILFLGYIPLSRAAKAGEPFIEDGPFDSENRIGQNVTRILEENGLRREDVYLTYALKCRGTRRPRDREVETCRPYFLRQLELIQPQLVVALGEPASRALIETSEDFSEFIGRLHDYERLDRIKILPTHVPTSYGNTEEKTDEAIAHLKDAIATLDM